jgi:hypothetical protein
LEGEDVVSGAEEDTLRQKVLWVGDWVIGGANGRIPMANPVDCPEEPDTVWTLYLETSKEAPPSLPMVPRHLHNAFLEDKVHDWNWANGQLRYRSRVMDRPVWLLLIYNDKLKRPRKKS